MKQRLLLRSMFLALTAATAHAQGTASPEAPTPPPDAAPVSQPTSDIALPAAPISAPADAPSAELAPIGPQSRVPNNWRIGLGLGLDVSMQSEDIATTSAVRIRMPSGHSLEVSGSLRRGSTEIQRGNYAENYNQDLAGIDVKVHFPVAKRGHNEARVWVGAGLASASLHSAQEKPTSSSKHGTAGLVLEHWLSDDISLTVSASLLGLTSVVITDETDTTPRKEPVEAYRFDIFSHAGAMLNLYF